MAWPPERPEPTMAVAFFPFQTLKPPVSASSLLAPNGPNVSYYFVERLSYGCSQLHSEAFFTVLSILLRVQ